MFKVLIPEDIAESGKNYLRARGYDLKVGCSTDEETLSRELLGADAVIVRNAQYRRAVFENSEHLRVIARHGTGTDNIDVKAAEEKGIWVVNGPVANINAVAEYAMSLVLAMSKELFATDRNTRKGDWTWRLRKETHELSNQTLGIIGYGNIGKLVAKKAALGFGMNVLAYDIRRPDVDMEGVTVTEDFERVIRESDYVTVHVPSTNTTRKMFNRNLFGKMKKGSCFINCARGDLYVADDLIEALENGQLKYAALDVYETEPLPESSKLLRMDNIIISQHNAGLSEESKDKMSLFAAMGVDQVLSGLVPTWPVNHPKVYM